MTRRIGNHFSFGAFRALFLSNPKIKLKNPVLIGLNPCTCNYSPPQKTLREPLYILKEKIFNGNKNCAFFKSFFFFPKKKNDIVSQVRKPTVSRSFIHKGPVFHIDHLLRGRRKWRGIIGSG